MVPPKILEQLSRVRGREKALRLAWGLARLVALSAGALFAACLIDWLVDLRTETPQALRALLLAAQIALALGALAVLVVRPLREPLSDRDLALWVEEKFPEFGHRLITTVQLEAPGARTEGMSRELLDAVTRQAEEKAAGAVFTSRQESSRFKRAAAILGGVLALAALCAYGAPRTTAALLARQLLASREIPRSVAIEPLVLDQVRPSGEEVKLVFRATGNRTFHRLSGWVEVDPKDRPSEEYPLVFEAEGKPEGAVFAATVPPSSVNFRYRAWLRDGRSRATAGVRYEPRPVVQKIDAWVQMPPYCGLKADGKPYEQYRVRGEIAGPQGCSARLAVEVQKPVVKGEIELLGRSGLDPGPEKTLRKVPLALSKGGLAGEGVFDLRPGETSYRILVEDKNGFANSTPPRRGIAIIPEEPPRVLLLAERFEFAGEAHGSDDAEVEGMPIPIGGPVRIAYYCAHPYGLDRARLAYRVIKAAKSADETVVEPDVPWQYLPLAEVRGTEEVGPFDLRRGRFEKSGFLDQVEFYPMPSPDPAHVHGRVEGGGSFDFQTKALQGVQVGDQLELRVEVFARNPSLSGSPGRSEIRVKSFVTLRQFTDWVMETLKHESRIRGLESRQRGVFTPEGDR